MNTICESDLQFLKPGKRVLLKSFQGSLIAPHDVKPEQNYWLLIGSKAVVMERAHDNQTAMLRFEQNFAALGLNSLSGEENALRILFSDLKFVCRY